MTEWPRKPPDDEIAVTLRHGIWRDNRPAFGLRDTFDTALDLDGVMNGAAILPLPCDAADVRFGHERS
jgi:hypothetical protein